MFRYDSETNSLIEIRETTFREKSILEKDHIEEWIRKQPDLLGEDLLVISHEYDKFDTSDRLDLLALDKDGKLVIIELKRDKSGSSVDFQCLKYCSYCSQLSPQDIIELFSDYLAKDNISNDPVDLITDFLEIPQGNEDSLNDILNNSQRFIIVGKEINKRILSVCAWLYENNIEAKCLNIVPYENERGEIYIDIDQIIPPFKIGDFYIQKKESQLRSSKIHQPDYIIAFFESVLEFVRKNSNFKIHYSPRKAYCNIRSGGKINYALRYFKRSKSFSIHAVTKDSDLKERFEAFYGQHSENLGELLSCEMQYQPEGERNPNWSYIRALVDADKNTALPEQAPGIGGKFADFCKYFDDNWV
ncbi:MAG: hypothetical protein CMN78_00790 [Spirochaetales bacterium]|nr:hypothetical protein [Spirochaetales bacterium]